MIADVSDVEDARLIRIGCNYSIASRCMYRPGNESGLLQRFTIDFGWDISTLIRLELLYNLFDIFPIEMGQI